MSAESKEKCGVFGVYGHGHDVARETFFGLFALQHRGQESAGIVTSNGKEFHRRRGMGLVTQVFNEQDMESLDNRDGFISIGHVRYSTSKESTIDHCQPFSDDEGIVAVSHNGNLPSEVKLDEFLLDKSRPYSHLNDSGKMGEAVRFYMSRGASIEDAIIDSSSLFTGAYSMLFMSEDKLVAVRDECGIRPLSLGKLNGGYVIASETCAFDTVGASFIRDVEPGEMVVISDKGITSEQIIKPNPKLDIFEFVYFSRPESMLLGRRVNEVRRNLGILLADQIAQSGGIEADVVIPVPDSGTPAALGFSRASGIPFDQGLIKNRYINRTFIQPGHMRKKDADLKYNPIPEVVKGKRVVVIDDSIVHGTTNIRVVDILKQAGAKEVHLAISSPPVISPDYYGIDTPDKTTLIAAQMTIDEMRQKFGADSLNFLSLDRLIQATGLPEDRFSTSHFTGVYPIDIRERAREFQLV